LQNYKIKPLNLFHSIDTYCSTKKTIATIGTFDGVHIGHQQILNKLILSAKNEGCESLILTFFPHPKMVLQNHSDIKLLNTIDERIELLSNTDLDHLIIHPFNNEFAMLSAEDFVKNILVDKLNIHKIIIGYDHHFGRNRTANINDLIVFGKKYNFEVEQISVQEIQKVSVSSTKIRTAIENGNIELANEYLGYSYFFEGIVQKGKQIGRTIGFPTANIKVKENYKLIPKNGVYIIKSFINNLTVFGMMNIGTNPTVNGNNQSIEVHFIDFDGDLYNQNIRITVLKHLREEQKFDSIELLKNQLEKDKQTTLSFFKNSI
jgi:riboflavin kinase/FMN adenylyltransferase